MESSEKVVAVIMVGGPTKGIGVARDRTFVFPSGFEVPFI